MPNPIELQPINLDDLVTEIKAAATAVLDQDVTTLRGFSERQIKAIAQQTQLVATGIASGQITEETREFFLDSLEDMALNFAPSPSTAASAGSPAGAPVSTSILSSR